MDFFRRKLKDRKFKKAGDGHRLGGAGTEDTPSSGKGPSPPSSFVGSSHSSSCGQHQQPERELSAAARAAQDRFMRGKASARPSSATSKPIATSQQVDNFPTRSRASPSGSAIDAVSCEPQHQSDWTDESDRLQVRVICPITGDSVRECDKLDHLRTVLKKGLEDSPLLFAAKMVWSLNSTEQQELAVKTLSAYITNALKHPEDPKYRRINKENKAFQLLIQEKSNQKGSADGKTGYFIVLDIFDPTRVANTEGAIEFLVAIGFEEEYIEDESKAFLVLPDHINASELETAHDVITSDQKVICRLHRDPRVLKPPRSSNINSAAKVTLPSDFYQFTAEDAKARQQQLAQERDKLTTLRTQAMRDAELAQGQKQYRFCLIRIRFPDGTILQGTFHVRDRVSTVRKFVQDSLHDESRPFYLYTHPSRKRLDDVNLTLKEAGLVPSSLLNFGWQDGEVSKTPSLKSTLLEQMRILSN
eukprot:gene1276-4483_t